MWWFPLATAAAIAIILIATQYWQDRRRRRGAATYRGRFLEVVHRLEELTNKANVLGQHAAKVRDRGALDYFESCLRVLETLLRVVRDMPAFALEPSAANSALFLVKDTERRLMRAQEGFAAAMKGMAQDAHALHGARPSPVADGCYFCSRPFQAERFAMTRAKLDGETREVMACEYCREELRTTKKIKVLHFMKDGRTVHWSQMPGYRPSQDYWTLNERRTLAPRKLEISHWRGEKDPDPKKP